MSNATTAYAAKLRTPFAVLGIRTDGRAVTRVTYLPRDERAQAPADDVAEQVGARARTLSRRSRIPLHRSARARGHAVPAARLAGARSDPAGRSRTYGEVARMVRSAPRAVGQACGANRIALIIPCHRVVGAMGSLGGFMNADDGDPHRRSSAGCCATRAIASEPDE